MKFLLVLSCAVACVLAKPGVAPVGVVAYSNIVPAAAGTYALGDVPISYAAHAPTSYTAPAVAYSSAVAPAVAYTNPAVAIASPGPAIVAASPAVVGVKTQYHAQDELGQAAYGHAEHLQAHSAVQDIHGNKIGAYSYVAPNGQVIATKYVADALGYRVASNALPVGPGAGPAPVADTAEVVAARAAHLAEVAAARSRVRRDAIAVGHVPASTVPLTHSITYAAAPAGTYTGPVTAPVVYSAPAAVHVPTVTSVAVATPAVAHANPGLVPAVPVAHSVVAAAPAVRAATLTTVVNNPGHAVSYRVD